MWKHLEAQPGWRDALEVRGIGEERKHLVARTRDNLGALEYIHGASTVAEALRLHQPRFRVRCLDAGRGARSDDVTSAQRMKSIFPTTTGLSASMNAFM